MFTEAEILRTIEKMQDRGVEFSEGLTEQSLSKIESQLQGGIPQDLRLLLSKAVPIYAPGDESKDIFPRWDCNIDDTIQNSQKFVKDLMAADIETEGYWNSLFGKQPIDKNLALKHALEYLDECPKLIPIYGHRYMIMNNNESPILSYHGPMDTIIYASNIVDFLALDFGIEPIVKIGNNKVKGFWATLL